MRSRFAFSTLVLTLVTGSIWAKVSWGQWWVWSERQLTLFLILFLFYSAYFMLRYSTDPGPRRSRTSAVYALFGVALIPVSFMAIRLAEGLIHPVVFKRDGPDMEGSMFLTFCVCLAAMLALAGALSDEAQATRRVLLRADWVYDDALVRGLVAAETDLALFAVDGTAVAASPLVGDG